MDLLKRGVDLLATVRKRSHSQTVSIQRGAGGTPTTGVPATIGRSMDMQLDADTGVMLERETRDFIILAADYVIDGTAVEPQLNDRIIDSVSGEAITYRVLEGQRGDEARWHDRYGGSWRIHTKRLT